MGDEDLDFEAYRAPENDVGDWSSERGRVSDAEAQSIRREHIKHETVIKLIGILCAAVGVLGAFQSALMLALVPMSREDLIAPAGFLIGSSMFSLAYSVFFVWLGLGLKQLSNAARIVFAVMTLISAVFVAFFLLFMIAAALLSGELTPILMALALVLVLGGLNCYCLYLSLSNKARTIFSPRYQEVIEKTPHIHNYLGCWIMLMVIALVAITIIVFGILIFQVD